MSTKDPQRPHGAEATEGAGAEQSGASNPFAAAPVKGPAGSGPAPDRSHAAGSGYSGTYSTLPLGSAQSRGFSALRSSSSLGSTPSASSLAPGSPPLPLRATSSALTVERGKTDVFSRAAKTWFSPRASYRALESVVATGDVARKKSRLFPRGRDLL